MEDAISSWNLRARVLFRGGEQWTRVFSSTYSGADYPLLLPGSIARCWEYLGHETVAIPAIIAGLFTFGTVGLACSALSMVRGRSQGMLGGLMLLGTPYFLIHGASQYADVPLGFFFLATLALFCLQGRFPEHGRGMLVLAGMTAGMAAWTKNEGLLFFLAVVVARLAVSRGDWRSYLREMGYFAAGAAPILVLVMYLKAHYAPPNYLLATQSVRQTADKLTDVSRYILIIKTFLKESIQFSGALIPPVPVLAVYLVCLGIRVDERDRAGIGTALLVLGMMAMGYFFIFVTSPFALVWHMMTALSRLILHLWPSAVFTFFMIAGTPEKAFDRRPRCCAGGSGQSSRSPAGQQADSRPPRCRDKTA